MKLFYSEMSPFARKVRACAIALGIDGQIELIASTSAQPADDLVAANPLGKIPTLVAEDGAAIFDSTVICEYLNGISGVAPIIPASGAPRWLCLRQQALGDGLMDAAVARIYLEQNKVAPDNPLAIRHHSAVTRTLDHLERSCPSLHVDVGTLSIACALGFLDLKFPDEPWRMAHPHLSLWFESMSTQPCLSQTAPH